MTGIISGASALIDAAPVSALEGISGHSTGDVELPNVPIVAGVEGVTSAASPQSIVEVTSVPGFDSIIEVVAPVGSGSEPGGDDNEDDGADAGEIAMGIFLGAKGYHGKI